MEQYGEERLMQYSLIETNSDCTW
ncbi:hypothetical protein GN244_ATG16853 [Phytophthora infestans]|uniref:Uncharacterized protein n=1 Tax=Phytophthora infestans TaxID=4787 RepID=A0A833RRD0_PHYIN|nr:hypothetical protein GN244_ATG16853 [Phytophthora infestans]